MAEINLDEDIKRLLVENLADTKIIKEEIVRIRAYMKWRTVMTFVWIILFILPLVASFFFIPDILKGFSTSSAMIQSLGL